MGKGKRRKGGKGKFTAKKKAEKKGFIVRYSGK